MVGSRRWVVAVRLAPAQWLLACAVAAWWLAPAHSAPAADHWSEQVDFSPFQCRADFSLDPYAPLLNELEQLRQSLAVTLEIPLATAPIELYLFADQQRYERYLTARYPNVPARRALFVKDRGPGMVFAFRSDELAVDLRHETTHALLHATLPSVPLWLDEGLAEYFETSPRQRVSGSPHLAEVRQAARHGYMPRLEALETIEELSQMGREQYRDAWAWIHFMIHGPPAARKELVTYLNDIEADRPAGLLSRRLARRVYDVRGHYVRHFAAWHETAERDRPPQ